MYAPALWPAACTDACAAVMSGARLANRYDAVDFSEAGLKGAGELLLDETSFVPCCATSVRLRCASRMASMSAQRFEKAVETFL